MKTSMHNRVEEVIYGPKKLDTITFQIGDGGVTRIAKMPRL